MNAELLPPLEIRRLPTACVVDLQGPVMFGIHVAKNLDGSIRVLNYGMRVNPDYRKLPALPLTDSGLESSSLVS
jgi:hypothetical protein